MIWARPQLRDRVAPVLLPSKYLALRELLGV